MNRRSFLIAALMIPVADVASAHMWQSDTKPLSDSDVGDVIAGLRALGDGARAKGWTQPSGARDRLTDAVYLYAADADALGTLPHFTLRTLVAYEALVDGQVMPDGSFADGADVFGMAETLHQGDVPAVAGQLDAIKALGALFSVGVQ